jgi:hypothetical protein
MTRSPSASMPRTDIGEMSTLRPDSQPPVSTTK